jgi:uncharacterized MAPEG superfamily protein
MNGTNGDALLAASVLIPLMLLKVFITNMLQGKSQRRAGVGPSEDWNNQSPQGSAKVAADASMARWLKITQNDAENVPYGVIAMALSALAVSNSSVVAIDLQRCQVAFQALYVFFRTLHTIVFAWEMQPSRTIFFLLAQMVFFAMLIILPVATFQRRSEFEIA